MFKPPSKELVAEVLKTMKTIHSVDTFDTRLDYQGTSIEGNIVSGTINLDTFARKCKEWLWVTHNLEIVSGITDSEPDNSKLYWSSTIKRISYTDKEEYLDDLGINTMIRRHYQDKLFDDIDTEPESIYEACEWIRLHLINKD